MTLQVPAVFPLAATETWVEYPPTLELPPGDLGWGSGMPFAATGRRDSSFGLYSFPTLGLAVREKEWYDVVSLS